MLVLFLILGRAFSLSPLMLTTERDVPCGFFWCLYPGCGCSLLFLVCFVIHHERSIEILLDAVSAFS